MSKSSIRCSNFKLRVLIFVMLECEGIRGNSDVATIGFSVNKGIDLKVLRRE